MDKILWHKVLQDIMTQEVQQDVPMKKHTTWKIGGPADFFVRPSSEGELVALLQLLHKENMPWLVLGNGSNVLVGDKGIRGVVIKMSEHFAATSWRENTLEAEAGAMLNTLSLEAAERSWGGMEFAAGIPGSIGGAVRMNAGAYGHTVGEYVTKIDAIAYDGNKKTISAAELSFAYRVSSLFALEAIVSKVYLEFPPGNREESMAKRNELLQLRNLKQPLEFPSCGSVFRNPENDHAGRLIELAHLRGLQIGGAAVSKKHGNFIINLGGARAIDVCALIEEIQKQVYDHFGVHLDPEVKMLGEF